MVQNKKKTLFIIGLICLLISTFCFISYSKTEEQEVIIKSITPVYDNESTILVDNNTVTFNDKNQTIKYNVVIENTQNYDIKLTDLQLTTPTEDFLNYTIENLEIEDEIKANETKELVISFETVKTEGWGRNFNDELITTLYFTEIERKEEVIPPPENPEDDNEGDSPDKPTDGPEDKPTDGPEDKPTDGPEDKPTDAPEDKPTDAPEDKPTDNPSDTPTEPPAVDSPEKPPINTDTPEKEEQITKPEDEQTTPPVNDDVGGTKEPSNDSNVSTNNNNGNINTGNDTNTNNSQSGNNGTIDETQKEETNDEVSPVPENPDDSHQIELDDKTNTNKTSTAVIVFTFGIAFGVCGVGLIIINKKKLTKYLIIVFVIGSSIKIAKADEIIELAIPMNVNYKSQNIMKSSSCTYDPNASYPTGCSNFWERRDEIKAIFFQDEISEITEYYKKYDVSLAENGKVIAYLVSRTDNQAHYDLYIQADGIIYANEDMSYYFAGMTLDLINNLDILDTSNATNMEWLFSDTKFKSDFYELDLTSFNTSNVTNMNHAFYKLTTTSSKFRVNLSSFDTSNVTDMSYMFSDIAKSSKDFILDLSNFDTSNVTTMKMMFLSAGYSSENFTLDLSNFDTSKVTDMNYMFYNTGYTSPIFTLDVSSFDTSNVTDMSGMFSAAGINSQYYTIDVSNFDTSKVNDMSYMFYLNGKSNPNFTLDVSNFDTSNVISMAGMFSGTGQKATEFKLDISNFDTTNTKTMSWMFNSMGSNSNKLTLILGNFDTSNVGDFSGMFYETGYAANEINVDLSKLTFKKAYNTSNMFYNMGYETNNMNVEITIDSPFITSYEEMFTNVAINPNTKLKVNYTTKTENIVDQMLLTKTEGSNVIKGWNINKIFTFNIGETTYKASENMTWEQWIESEFNTDGYYILEEGITNNNEEAWVFEDDGNTKVNASSKIITDYNYEIVNHTT